MQQFPIDFTLSHREIWSGQEHDSSLSCFPGQTCYFDVPIINLHFSNFISCFWREIQILQSSNFRPFIHLFPPNKFVDWHSQKKTYSLTFLLAFIDSSLFDCLLLHNTRSRFVIRTKKKNKIFMPFSIHSRNHSTFLRVKFL
jgi:hypothetical protein